MYHIYLLVSLFSVVSSDPLSFVDLRPTEDSAAKAPINIEVRFDSVPQVNVGDPVLFNGSLVGNVSSVNFSKDLVNSGSENLPMNNLAQKSEVSLSGLTGSSGEDLSPSVSIRINSRDLPPSEQLFVLASSLKVVNGKTPGSRSFIELMKLQAPVADSGAAGNSELGKNSDDKSGVNALKGFSSFEEFWRGGAH